MTDLLDSIARDEVSAAEAENQLAGILKEKLPTSEVYSALVRWVWSALTERRLDDDLRRWHRVILDVAAQIEFGRSDPSVDSANGAHFAERLRALADVLTISVSMARAPDAQLVMSRAHTLEVLKTLSESAQPFMDRAVLQDKVGLRTANLSRVLKLLLLNGLVERETRGRKARFSITTVGRQSLAKYEEEHRTSGMHDSTDATVGQELKVDPASEQLRSLKSSEFVETVARVDEALSALDQHSEQASGPAQALDYRGVSPQSRGHFSETFRVYSPGRFASAQEHLGAPPTADHGKSSLFAELLLSSSSGMGNELTTVMLVDADPSTKRQQVWGVSVEPNEVCLGANLAARADGAVHGIEVQSVPPEYSPRYFFNVIRYNTDPSSTVSEKLRRIANVMQHVAPVGVSKGR